MKERKYYLLACDEVKQCVIDQVYFEISENHLKQISKYVFDRLNDALDKNTTGLNIQ
jgi:hypothetical protein